MKKTDVKQLAKILRVLANEKRLMILQFLIAGEELNVGSISEKINLSFKSTSRHLAILTQADLITWHRVRNNVIYCLAKIDNFLHQELLDIVKKYL